MREDHGWKMVEDVFIPIFSVIVLYNMALVIAIAYPWSVVSAVQPCMLYVPVSSRSSNNLPPTRPFSLSPTAFCLGLRNPLERALLSKGRDQIHDQLGRRGEEACGGEGRGRGRASRTMTIRRAWFVGNIRPLEGRGGRFLGRFVAWGDSCCGEVRFTWRMRSRGGHDEDSRRQSVTVGMMQHFNGCMSGTRLVVGLTWLVQVVCVRQMDRSV